MGREVMNFWDRIDKSGGPNACWPCVLGGRSSKGYMYISILGKTVGAHRMAWELTHGPIPPGMCVCHHCDNHPCCNPQHLFIGTHLDNYLDAVAKGRIDPERNPVYTHPHRVPRGENHCRAILRERDVIHIRREYALQHTSLKVLAKKWGVHFSTVSRAISGKAWKHLERGEVQVSPQGVTQ